MTVFARQLARATLAIKAKGEACTWTKTDADITGDPTKPWSPATSQDGGHAVSIVWVPEASAINPALWAQQDNAALSIPGGWKFGLMHAVDFAPNENDIITCSNGAKWTVDRVDPLSPDGTPLLYTIRARQ